MQAFIKSHSHKRKSGFTLVELMVVIMIISILSGVVLSAMNSSDDSRALDAGVTRLDSLFSLAHSAAITRKQTVRVLINFDNSTIDKPNEPQKMLRYATIVYLDDDGKWKAYTEGEFLPDGVYFTPALSTKSGGENLQLWTASINDSDLKVTDTDTYSEGSAYNLSGNEDGVNHSPGPNKWYYFEFAPNGTFRNPGVRVVLTNAIVLPDAHLLINVDGDAEPADMAKGFVVFRSGKVLHFQSGEQIKEGNS
ncbi:prepilin-type N-terminal cleavage/methylation domain-containing protein [Kiritimatiellaeota bacterium B1221]|nr:prepilin-type N-terminal cleavage/methylation domain-containing protein [Kiritimatiellaeota bacterium B1221]